MKESNTRRIVPLILFILAIGLNNALAEEEKASVMLDNKVLFPIHHGMFGYSAAVRAKQISNRIEMLAKDYSISPDSITIIDDLGFSQITAGDRLIFAVNDADGSTAGKTRAELAKQHAEDIKKAVIQYRIDYSRKQIVRGIALSVLATLAAILLFKFLMRLYGKILEKMRARATERYGKILEDSRAKSVLDSVIVFLNLIRFLLFAILTLVLVEIILGALPWTRPFAHDVMGYVLIPLKSLWQGFVHQVPNLVFLVVLIVVINYLLKLIHIFFSLIEFGRITIRGFEPEWSRPTYNIVRLAVIAFAMVVAFPYLPGSDSPAFKGISVFIGILFSLGSSSFVASAIAGLSLTYRRAYKVGDLVRIGEAIGIVTSIRLTVTQLRTAKNELITVPNSEAVNSTVINYSALASDSGLILHTAITIGYDVPWRQVEALLLLAASKTPGILKDPEPFVLQRELQDFYVKYELNAYASTPSQLLVTYSNLHRNIQDAFNEYGVQIMSPNYEADPEGPKIVPKDKWYASPARENHDE